jgi:hypothetical protein
MIETYKVLGAMLALNEFTADELAHYTGAKVTTVRTILNREQSYLEEVGRLETGRKGGQCRRLRVKPVLLQSLRNRIENLFAQIKLAPSGSAEPEFATDSASAPQVPLSLLVAEDILVRRFPEAKDAAEKRSLIELAEVNFDTGRTECETLPEGCNLDALKAHMRTIEDLFNLCRMELEAEVTQPPRQGRWAVQDVFQRLTAVSAELWNLGGGENQKLAFATSQRVAKSHVVNMALGW